MSGGAIFQQTLRELQRFDIPRETRADLLTVLEAGRPALRFINEAAAEPGFDRETTLARAAGIFVLSATSNVADDLIDGEVDYLRDPVRVVPVLQYMLQNLATTILARNGVRPPELATLGEQLFQAAMLGHAELHITNWTFETYVSVIRACAGRQYAGYLAALWSGSPVATHAEPAGIEIGSAACIVHDFELRKARFWSLSPADRQKALAWALELLASAERRQLSCTRLLVTSLRPVLEKAAAAEETSAHGSARTDVTRWYDEKTAWLLDKYGPGPRVHFHTGLVSPEEAAAPSAAGLQRQIVKAQEAMLDHMSVVWEAEKNLTGHVLDIGCGLGGSALYFAEKYGARVTALTPVPRHAELVTRFAAQAKLSARVSARLGDAHALPRDRAYDAAYAIGASTYFDRPRWFQELAQVVRPGGHVMIQDTFLGRPDAAAPFDTYWLTSIGTLEQYVAAARDVGFRLVRQEEATVGASHFYRLSVAHSDALLHERSLDDREREKRARSIAWQSDFARGYLDGRYRDYLLLFVRDC